MSGSRQGWSSRDLVRGGAGIAVVGASTVAGMAEIRPGSPADVRRRSRLIACRLRAVANDPGAVRSAESPLARRPRLERYRPGQGYSNASLLLRIRPSIVRIAAALLCSSAKKGVSDLGGFGVLAAWPAPVRSLAQTATLASISPPATASARALSQEPRGADVAAIQPIAQGLPALDDLLGQVRPDQSSSRASPSEPPRHAQRGRSAMSVLEACNSIRNRPARSPSHRTVPNLARSEASISCLPNRR